MGRLILFRPVVDVFVRFNLTKPSAVRGEEEDEAGQAEQQPRERRPAVPRLLNRHLLFFALGKIFHPHLGSSFWVRFAVRIR